MTNKSFSNPYVEKIKDFTGLVFDKQTLLPFISKISLPIILDIGCGNGEYLTDSALKDQKHFYIGFERQFKEVHRTALKIQKLGLKNCVVVSMNAREIPLLFKHGSVDGAFILFPDPWPKTKQKKNRLIQKGFILELAELIHKKGFLKIRTDNDDYFMHMLTVLYDKDVVSVLHPQELSRDFRSMSFANTEYITPFERIFLRAGVLINYIFLKRV